MGGKHIMVACILAYSEGETIARDIRIYLWSNGSKLMDGDLIIVNLNGVGSVDSYG
jgi:hypothetical protein